MTLYNTNHQSPKKWAVSCVTAVGIMCSAFSFSAVNAAETPLYIPIKDYEAIHSHVVQMDKSFKELAEKSENISLQQEIQTFNDAGGGIEAADDLIDAGLSSIEEVIPPIEKHEKNLAHLRTIIAKAAQNATPDENSLRGSEREVELFNNVVSNIAGWGDVFDQFNGHPALERNTREMRKILSGMRNEILIARSNPSHFTMSTFRKIDQRLLDYQLRLHDYVRGLKEMVAGIVNARQTGKVAETINRLDTLLGDIDHELVPALVDRSFTKALRIVANGSSSDESYDNNAGYHQPTFSDLYIDN